MPPARLLGRWRSTNGRVAAFDAARSSACARSRLGSACVVGPRARPGGRVKVQVRYRAATDVALIGALLGDVDLGADATMRVER